MQALESYEFKAGTGVRGKHDWDTLTDGGVYQLESGVDFVEASKFAVGNSAKQQAAKRGLAIRMNYTPEGNIVLQCSGHDDDDRQERIDAYAVKAAEAKARAEAKAAEKEVVGPPKPATKPTTKPHGKGKGK